MASKKKNIKKKNTKNTSANRNTLISFFLIITGVFFISTIFSADYDNYIGVLGGAFLYIFKGFFGNVLILVSLSLIFIGVYRLINKEKVRISFYYALVLINISMFMIFQINYIEKLSFQSLQEAFLLQKGGGIIGAFFGDIIYYSFGIVGYWLVFLALLIIGTVLLVNEITALSRIKNYSTKVISDLQEERQAKKEILYKHKEKIKEEEKKDRLKDYEKQLWLNATLDKEDFAKKTTDESKKQEENKIKFNFKDEEPPQFNIDKNTNDKPVVSIINSEDNIEENDFKGSLKSHHPVKWILPGTVLLNSLKKDKEYGKKSELEATALRLEETLRSFGVNIQVKDVNCGPSITRYEAVLEPGTKVSKIQGLSEDIALALAATSVRIEAPIPGKSAVGFEIPNKKVLPVSFKEIIMSTAFKDSNLPLTMGIGKDITGKTVTTSLAEMPHLLIAGSTGSGKSVCLNTIICSLLFKYTPDELKFLMIDPKKVELNLYNDIPHLVAPVVTEPKKAATALKWMVNEMERRYQLLSDAGVKDIKTFNSNVKMTERIPYVVIIIDELADLMMAAPVDVETYICRLAQKARAAGLHLIVATQRPSVQVITGDIKSNIPMRIAFAVFSQIDARTILDSTGAEKLLGKGDMLFTLKGGKLQRIQGAYISEEEIVNITKFLKKQGAPEYLQGSEMIDVDIDEEDDTVSHRNNDKEDDLLKEAAKLVLETDQASISMLQRKLRIGYSRAARLIDDLEAKGIVGPFEGTKSRDVIANWEEFGKIFGDIDG